jgi:hypothetical protein
MPYSHQNTTPFLEDDPGQRRFKYTDILFAFPDVEREGIKNIIILAWKFIIRLFYQNSLSPVAFTDCKSISKLILGGFAELALGWSQHIKRRIYTQTPAAALYNQHPKMPPHVTAPR